MTSPMQPQQPQQPVMLQPPQPPPSPFIPKPNDAEPAKATVVMKRLSKLFEDPEFSKQPPEWQQLPAMVYQAAVQALQPPPVLPHGVNINMKGDASTVGAEEQAALHPGQQQPQQPVRAQNGEGVKQPSHPTAPQMPSMHGPQKATRGPARPL